MAKLLKLKQPFTPLTSKEVQDKSDDELKKIAINGLKDSQGRNEARQRRSERCRGRRGGAVRSHVEVGPIRSSGSQIGGICEGS